MRSWGFAKMRDSRRGVGRIESDPPFSVGELIDTSAAGRWFHFKDKEGVHIDEKP